jgi:hypothetical protein
MRSRLVFAFLALAASADAALAQQIAIHPGEMLTIRLQDGTAVIAERGPAKPLNTYDAGLLRRMQVETTQIPKGTTVVAPEPIYEGDIAGTPRGAVAGEAQISFYHVQGVEPGASADSMLIITNGFDQSFRYRAVMHKDGRAVPTDVCEVMPGKPGAEHWAYSIDWLDLSDIRLEPFHDGEMRCQ